MQLRPKSPPRQPVAARGTRGRSTCNPMSQRPEFRPSYDATKTLEMRKQARLVCQWKQRRRSILIPHPGPWLQRPQRPPAWPTPSQSSEWHAAHHIKQASCNTRALAERPSKSKSAARLTPIIACRHTCRYCASSQSVSFPAFAQCCLRTDPRGRSVAVAEIFENDVPKCRQGQVPTSPLPSMTATALLVMEYIERPLYTQEYICTAKANALSGGYSATANASDLGRAVRCEHGWILRL